MHSAAAGPFLDRQGSPPGDCERRGTGLSFFFFQQVLLLRIGRRKLADRAVDFYYPRVGDECVRWPRCSRRNTSLNTASYVANVVIDGSRKSILPQHAGHAKAPGSVSELVDQCRSRSRRRFWLPAHSGPTPVGRMSVTWPCFRSSPAILWGKKKKKKRRQSCRTGPLEVRFPQAQSARTPELSLQLMA